MLCLTFDLSAQETPIVVSHGGLLSEYRINLQSSSVRPLWNVQIPQTIGGVSVNAGGSTDVAGLLDGRIAVLLAGQISGISSQLAFYEPSTARWSLANTAPIGKLLTAAHGMPLVDLATAFGPSSSGALYIAESLQPGRLVAFDSISRGFRAFDSQTFPGLGLTPDQSFALLASDYSGSLFVVKGGGYVVDELQYESGDFRRRSSTMIQSDWTRAIDLSGIAVSRSRDIYAFANGWTDAGPATNLVRVKVGGTQLLNATSIAASERPFHDIDVLSSGEVVLANQRGELWVFRPDLRLALRFEAGRAPSYISELWNTPPCISRISAILDSGWYSSNSPALDVRNLVAKETPEGGVVLSYANTNSLTINPPQNSSLRVGSWDARFTTVPGNLYSIEMPKLNAGGTPSDFQCVAGSSFPFAIDRLERGLYGQLTRIEARFDPYCSASGSYQAGFLRTYANFCRTNTGVLGDGNCDGVVNILDKKLLTKALNLLQTSGPDAVKSLAGNCDLRLLDTNGNGALDRGDAAYLDAPSSTTTTVSTVPSIINSPAVE